MKPCNFFLINSFFTLLIIIPSSYSNANPSPSTLETTPLNSNASYAQLYNISKQLCWGCLKESLEFLVSHNLVRAKKLELPLVWDKDLEKYARWWVDQRSTDCALQHSFPDREFELGECIFWGGGSQWAPSNAIKTWANEEGYYDYDSNTCAEGQMCGHYTQIVWSTTRKLGCARVVCQDGDVFMTCNYYAPSNVIGECPY
ncbi:hypothetical protein Cgig2_024710 [Carnegiea gigantea]|uniref:SCP domain-containing protein n=1 Tax=Carnegiea gigantea TaxID=171969 RepID=A0A9Q1GKQ4_9CARY|nr:hypothetical protein Cgig2_024710 [Carnegiea gigantea]